MNEIHWALEALKRCEVYSENIHTYGNGKGDLTALEADLRNIRALLEAQKAEGVTSEDIDPPIIEPQVIGHINVTLGTSQPLEFQPTTDSSTAREGILEQFLDHIEAGNDAYEKSEVHGQAFWRDCISGQIKPLLDRRALAGAPVKTPLKLDSMVNKSSMGRLKSLWERFFPELVDEGFRIQDINLDDFLISFDFLAEKILKLPIPNPETIRSKILATVKRLQPFEVDALVKALS